MQAFIKEWIHTSREKFKSGTLDEKDFNRLEQLLTAPTQHILYLYSKSTNMRSALAGWVHYDPTKPDEPTLPSQDAPYTSVIEAVQDGWRIVQFPDPTRYEFSDVDNRYLGYEFILEKWQ